MPTRPLIEATTRAATSPAPDFDVELAAGAGEIEAGLTVGTYHPTAAELAGIDRGLADARAGRFATAKQVAAVFARYRRA